MCILEDYFFQGGVVKLIVSFSSITGIFSLTPDAKIGVIETSGLAWIIISYFVGSLTCMQLNPTYRCLW